MLVLNFYDTYSLAIFLDNKKEANGVETGYIINMMLLE